MASILENFGRREARRLPFAVKSILLYLQLVGMRQNMIGSLPQRPEDERFGLMRSMDKVMFGPVGRTGRSKRDVVG